MASHLKTTDHIHLLFISPYSPQLNHGRENIVEKVTRISGKLHKTLDHVGEFINVPVELLTEEIVKIICEHDDASSFPF